MRCRLTVSLLLGAIVAFSACGSSEHTIAGGDGPNASAATDPEATAPIAGGGGIGDAIAVMAAAPGQADEAACQADRQTLENAEEYFLILNGSLPTSQAELVEQQMIREASTRFEITEDGTIVPAPGSPCV